MEKKNMRANAEVEFTLRWSGAEAHHTDIYLGTRMNFWRDIFPPAVFHALADQDTGDTANFTFAPGEIIPPPDPNQRFLLKRSQFGPERPSVNGDAIQPREGRFFPKGLLRGVAGVFPQNLTPFRCTDITDDGLVVDFNHPLSGRELHLKTRMVTLRPKRSDKGGALTHWMETITDGPGIQARHQGRPTDFLSGNPFARGDETPDGRFYAVPRFVQHIDRQAIAFITDAYAALLRDGSRVLDLMSSWTSHLPEALRPSSVTGLGLNEAELAANPRLTERVVHDLNQSPMLPFPDHSHDAVLCTASVEYLTHPLEVFREIRRVLTPDGVFVVSFSNRWFEPKAISLWKHLHEFERMGLVLEYLLASGGFRDLETRSLRGWPRPDDDKYAAEFAYSDPVYLVWGRAMP